MVDLTVRDALKRAFGTLQRKPAPVPGLLGDGSGNVVVPNTNEAYVYVRMPDSQVVEVINKRAPAVTDMPVLVGYDPLEPQIFQVLATRTVAQNATNLVIAQVANHAQRHGMWSDDPIYIEKRQYLPGRVGPSSASAMNVTTWRDFNKSQGVWKFVLTTSANFTSYIPSTAGYARYVLVSIDTAGLPAYTLGTAVTSSTFGLANIPNTPAGHRALGAVQVYAGQSLTAESYHYTDFADLRGCDQNATEINGIPIATTAPADGAYLIYNTTAGMWVPSTAA